MRSGHDYISPFRYSSNSCQASMYSWNLSSGTPNLQVQTSLSNLHWSQQVVHVYFPLYSRSYLVCPQHTQIRSPIEVIQSDWNLSVKNYYPFPQFGASTFMDVPTINTHSIHTCNSGRYPNRWNPLYPTLHGAGPSRLRTSASPLCNPACHHR
jgi:hypothetical protein